MYLPVELKSPRKRLTNIKSNDEKCFFWCHVRHINPSKEHSERIRKIDEKLVKHISNLEKVIEKHKELLVILIMMELSFLCKIEMENNLCINVFGYEDQLFFPI